MEYSSLRITVKNLTQNKDLSGRRQNQVNSSLNWLFLKEEAYI